MMEGEPGFPLRVRKADRGLECFAERRQFLWKIGMLGEQRLLLPFVRRRAAHLADEMHNRVAMGDIDVELVECVAAEVLEVLLHLYRDIVPREVMDELIAVGVELVGNGRKKNADRHRAPVSV